MKMFFQDKKGYIWTKKGDSYFRGYIQSQTGEVKRGREAISYLEEGLAIDSLCEKLKDLYGTFAFISKKGEDVYAATDIARSMPIYFSKDLSVISDSSEIVREQLGIEKENIDFRRAAEFFDTTYVAHDNTVYSDIKQVEMGTVVKFSKGGYIKQLYYKHIQPVVHDSRNDAIAKLKSITEAALNRMLKVVNGRQIVLSLSGGYDSRYIACSLRSLGVENVICYTYGRSGSFETTQSEKIAKALGYKWYCYEYSDADIKGLLDEEAYFQYCNGHDYTIYLQNYIAVKKLTQEKKIEDDAVFITGLCNDMPTGFYIKAKEEIKSFGFTVKGCASYIINDRFVRYKLNNQRKQEFTQEVIDKINEYGIHIKDYESFWQAFTCVYTGYNHSRCFLNMNRVHEFFGHEWLLPCWDKELLEFWYSVPAEDKYHQSLYEEYICNRLAKSYGVGTKKHINYLGKTSFTRSFKRKVGGMLVRIAYPLGIPIKRKQDINNFAPFEILLYKKLVQKRAVKPERAALFLLLSTYLMERRYGTKWYAQIKEYFSK